MYLQKYNLERLEWKEYKDMGLQAIDFDFINKTLKINCLKISWVMITFGNKKEW